VGLFQIVRPLKLDDVVGNKAVVASLRSFTKIASDVRPHTYMFSGPSGCGKTTLARILANEFGCQNMDFVEHDAGSDSGVDAMRQIVQNAQFSPLSGASRVFLLDEVHDLSKQAFDTLLKVLEDTPTHTYFFLCTTNLVKVPTTIKTRCTSFAVQPLSNDDMGFLVERTLYQLNRELGNNAFTAIIKASGGCPRQAITDLERALTVDTEAQQMELLQDIVTEVNAVELCRALLNGATFGEIIKLYKRLPATEAESCRRVILGYMKQVILKGGGQKALVAGKIISIFRHNYFDSAEAGLLSDFYLTSTPNGRK